jgi:hypothetical protein
MSAPKLAVTEVIGTQLTVITVERLTHAHALLTMVALRARVSIEALASIKRRVDAALLARADVLCAGVSVVAHGLVDGAVTVIVEPVAGLLGWLGGAAGLETLLGAHPHALTEAELVLDRARRAQTGLDGQARAWTRAALRDALVALDLGGRLRLLAGVSVGARGL